MSTDSRQSHSGHNAGRSASRPHPRRPGGKRIDPFDLEELIRTVCASPAREMEPELVAVLAAASRRTPEFQLRLALTALRLEQRLRDTQEQVIRLQWELAQCQRRQRAPARAASQKPPA
jgi:hypothetical protein